MCKDCIKIIEDGLNRINQVVRKREAALFRAIKCFCSDVETNYMIDGEWVDDPGTMVKVNYEEMINTLKEFTLT